MMWLIIHGRWHDARMARDHDYLPSLSAGRFLRWWCRNVTGHRYVEGVCQRCTDTMW